MRCSFRIMDLNGRFAWTPATLLSLVWRRIMVNEGNISTQVTCNKDHEKGTSPPSLTHALWYTTGSLHAHAHSSWGSRFTETVDCNEFYWELHGIEATEIRSNLQDNVNKTAAVMIRPQTVFFTSHYSLMICEKTSSPVVFAFLFLTEAPDYNTNTAELTTWEWNPF